ncbi:carboxypeptidase-like regulatory domain-containing protein, partial [Aureispira]|nr:carboxypeptidase-like regulatory domain-containing protein [Aureispira sp.]
KTKTDHAGNYWFSKLTKGNYTLWVLHDGYCQLEMGRINLNNNSAIELDLGLMKNAINSNVETDSKIYMLYHQPISVNLIKETNYKNYKNEIQIISEVYNGNDIQIIPKIKPIPKLESNRVVHNHDSFKSLEKLSSFTSSGY